MNRSHVSDEFSPRATRWIRPIMVPLTKTTFLRRTWMTLGWMGKNVAAVWVGVMFAELNSFAVYLGLALFGIAALVEQIALFGLRPARTQLWKEGTASALDQAVSLLLAAVGASALSLPGVPPEVTLPVAIVAAILLFAFFIWNDGPVGSAIRDAS